MTSCLLLSQPYVIVQWEVSLHDPKVARPNRPSCPLPGGFMRAEGCQGCASGLGNAGVSTDL